MLDEPFSALDSFLRWELEQELMKVLGEFEGTSLLVSHNRDEVYRISDHISVMADGHVDCFDEKKRIFEDPYTYQSALLTDAKISPGRNISTNLTYWLPTGTVRCV